MSELPAYYYSCILGQSVGKIRVFEYEYYDITVSQSNNKWVIK